MLNFRYFILILLVLVFSAHSAAAQIISSSGNQTSSENKEDSAAFISVEGEFSISLPQKDFSGYRALTLAGTGNFGVGALYSFRKPEAGYDVGYINLAQSLQTAKDAEIKEKIKTFQNIILGFTIDDSQYKENRIGGNLVIDARAEIGYKYLFRYIRVGKRVYVLIATFDKELPEAAVLKIFDSIKFISNKEIIAQKVKEATPKPLPQTPALKKVRTDVEDDGLKGNVKSIVEENEDLTGTWTSQGRVLNWENHYDAQGNIVKRIFYSHLGFPNEITVYGFIDNARVSSSSEVGYESKLVISALTVRRVTGVPKPRDERYDNKIVNKYDANKRLIEEAIYSNDGTLSYKTVYLYKDNKIEEFRYNDEESLIYKEVKTLDDKGNEIESEYLWIKSKSGGKYTYTYEKFDEKGNWTKRIVKDSGGENAEEKYAEYRTITYYK